VVPEAAWAELRAHDWPGNVRELRNVIERCVLFAEGPLLPVEWLQLRRQDLKGMPGHASATEDGLFIPLDGSMALDDMDCYIIRTTLERHAGNVTATARALGTTRETLRYRIRKYGLKESS
jgi:two-component system response regulator AtoC